MQCHQASSNDPNMLSRDFIVSIAGLALSTDIEILAIERAALYLAGVVGVIFVFRFICTPKVVHYKCLTKTENTCDSDSRF